MPPPPLPIENLRYEERPGETFRAAASAAIGAGELLTAADTSHTPSGSVNTFLILQPAERASSSLAAHCSGGRDPASPRDSAARLAPQTGEKSRQQGTTSSERVCRSLKKRWIQALYCAVGG